MPRPRTRLAHAIILCICTGLAIPCAAEALHPSLAACADGDADGYGMPGDPSCPSGPEKDCDDNDPNIFPGAVEACNGIDDNCDTHVDECFIGDPDPGAGPCFSPGTLTCPSDPASATCVLDGDLLAFGPETAGTPACFDGADNDCDGEIDHEQLGCRTAELCNGFDDDNDGTVDGEFPDLGMACSDGAGECRSEGTFVCSADQLGVVCDSSAAGGATEDLTFKGSCLNGVDDDCDGLVDLQDPGCRAPELCDGRDNDGDGLVDETFVLGEPCVAGVGACSAEGIEVCSAGRTGSECNATPLRPAREGPAGESCRDTIDNDCDGRTDGEDPDCASASLAAWCSLPYLQGESGRDCTGWHKIRFGATGGSGTVKVTAELVGMGSDGTVLRSIPVVSGEMAHLASRSSVKARSRGNGTRVKHTLIAPVPMLRVRAEDGLNSSEAFCSILPYVHLIRPGGAVAHDGIMEVLAAIPMVNRESLSVLVDGVDIIRSLELDPSDDLGGDPVSGEVAIEGRTASIKGLVVDERANTLKMSVSGLGGGVHRVRVEAEPAGSFPARVARACSVQETVDEDLSIGFEVEIEEPLSREITSSVPTPFRATIVHGREIEGVRINGLPVDVADQQQIPGSATGAGDKYVLHVEAELIGTDLAAEIDDRLALPGTLDAGWNLLVLEATDSSGEAVFSRRPVAVSGSSTSPTPEIDNFVVSSVRSGGVRALVSGIYTAFGPDLFAFLDDEVLTPMAAGKPDAALPAEISPDVYPLAFSTGIPGDGRCLIPFFPQDDDGNCRFTFRRLGAGSDLKLDDLIFHENAFDFAGASVAFFQVSGPEGIRTELTIPDLDADWVVRPYVEFFSLRPICTTSVPPVCSLLPVCEFKLQAQIEGTVHIKGLTGATTLEKQALAGDEGPEAGILDLVDGMIKSLEITADRISFSNLSSKRAAGSAGCGSKANKDRVLEGLLGAVVSKLTRNDFIARKIAERANSTVKTVLSKYSGEIKKEARKELVKLLPGEIVIPDSMTKRGIAFRGRLGQVHFVHDDPDDMLPVVREGAAGASFSGSISSIHDEISLQSLSTTPAPDPAGPLAGAGDIYVAVSDDGFNQLLESLARAGHFGDLGTGACFEVGTLNELLLPDDCSRASTPWLKGYCSGTLEPALTCESLSGNNPDDTADMQGACHGARGDDCKAIPVPPVCCGGGRGGQCIPCAPDCSVTGGGSTVPAACSAREIGACESASILDREGDHPLSGCPRLNTYPGFMARGGVSGIPPFAAESPLTALRLNDIEVPVVITRTGRPVEPSSVETLAACGGAADAPGVNCRIASICSDASIGVTFDVTEPVNGNLAIKPRLTDISADLAGNGLCYTCGGSPLLALLGRDALCPARIDALVPYLNAALEAGLDPIELPVPISAATAFAAGVHPRLIAIETDGDTDFFDYLGVSFEVPSDQP